ncbi:MAG: cytochrome c maturation protein CcmE, partial [Armatimonadaceae bacterium]
KNLTPYISFAEAQKTNGTVQVMGGLEKSSVKMTSGNLAFTLVEKKTGTRLPVVFGHTKPANFEMAIEITAIGHWDGSVFQADNLLVKCPSKYQGTETKSYGTK